MGTKSARDSLAANKVAILNTVANKDMNAEQMAFKFYPYLCTKEYLAYCKDPFQDKACSNVLHHFLIQLMMKE